MNEHFEEELGVYVGPATMADVAETLAGNTPGQWVIRLTDAEGGVVWHRDGWSWVCVDGEDYFVLVVEPGQPSAGNPLVAEDAFVLSFATDTDLDASVYSGGLVINLGFGRYAGHTLTMLVWHSVLHETESGDIAPGFGPFETDVDEVDHGIED